MNKVLVWALVLAMMPTGGQAYAADNIDGLINGLFCKDEYGVHVCADFVPTDGIFYYGTYPNGKLIGKGMLRAARLMDRLKSIMKTGSWAQWQIIKTASWMDLLKAIMKTGSCKKR